MWMSYVHIIAWIYKYTTHILSLYNTHNRMAGSELHGLEVALTNMFLCNGIVDIHNTLCIIYMEFIYSGTYFKDHLNHLNHLSYVTIIELSTESSSLQ